MNGNKKDSGMLWQDSDEAPELNNTFFERAELRQGDHLIRRGRPKIDNPKISVTVRYDADVVAAFKASGRGWQSRMNAALRHWLATHQPTTEQ